MQNISIRYLRIIKNVLLTLALVALFFSVNSDVRSFLKMIDNFFVGYVAQSLQFTAVLFLGYFLYSYLYSKNTSIISLHKSSFLTKYDFAVLSAKILSFGGLLLVEPVMRASLLILILGANLLLVGGWVYTRSIIEEDHFLIKALLVCNSAYFLFLCVVPFSLFLNK
jgi:hypothetical protein